MALPPGIGSVGNLQGRVPGPHSSSCASDVIEKRARQSEGSRPSGGILDDLDRSVTDTGARNDPQCGAAAVCRLHLP